MLFHSYVFVLVFLPVVTWLWWGLSDREARLAMLTVASYLFYGYWEPRFTLLLFWSTALDYVAARLIHRSTGAARWRWVSLSVVANLATLGVFKYFDFFAGAANDSLRALGVEGALPLLNVVLPVGISFYTFQSMSYAVDVYRGQIEPAPSFLEFACFVSMFHQLVAGPIVRYSDIARQLSAPPARVVWREMSLGAHFFILGLVKKLLVADVIAARIDPLFANHEIIGPLASWVALCGYCAQLYFDFSGYSDMAIGLGLCHGFKFPQNFNSPYRAQSITEFWQRWHITLSTWLRDYVFIPLGGSRRGPARTAVNLFVTLMLGGLWHGAAWTFLAFSLYHAALLAAHFVLGRLGWRCPHRGLNQVFLVGMISLGMIGFRSTSGAMARSLIEAVFGLRGWPVAGELSEHQASALMVLAALVFMARAPNLWEIRLRARPAHAVGLAAALTVCLLAMEEPSPFLYFQF